MKENVWGTILPFLIFPFRFHSIGQAIVINSVSTCCQDLGAAQDLNLQPDLENLKPDRRQKQNQF